MKIYSKFKDYYDNIGYYGGDELIWSRKTSKLIINEKPRYRTTDYINNGLNPDTDNFMESALYDLPRINENRGRSSRRSDDFMIAVCLCGVLYPIIMYFIDYGKYKPFSTVEDYLKERKKDDRGKVASSMFGFGVSFPLTDDGLKQWVSLYNNRDRLINISLELNSPVFILQPGRCDIGNSAGNNLIVNPSLTDYNLVSIFPPYETYQEIDTFLSNDMVMAKLDTFEITDELKRDSKGMDEWSFKQKGPKKRKRK